MKIYSLRKTARLISSIPNKVNRQRGFATLLTTIIMLIGVTMLTLNSSRLSSIELLMSNNFESEKKAFNQSESTIDALYSIARTVINWNKGAGYSYCTATNSDLGTCSENTVTSANGLPTELESSQHQGKIEITRIGCPPRYLDTSCSGTLEFGHFEIKSSYDDSANRGAKSGAEVGVMEVLF